MRSLLFVPGDSDKKLAKSLTLGADALILDLEDSVAADRKSIGRETVRAFLSQYRRPAPSPLVGGGESRHTRLYVRINSMETPFWQDDLKVVMPAGPDGILLPKARSGADVARIAAMLDAHEASAGLALGSTKILALTSEVPIGVLQMHTYVECSPRLEGLTWGAEDLSAELGASANRDARGEFTSPYRLARDLTLFTAYAASAMAIDTVYVDLKNLEGFRRECVEAARDGFTAKMAVHPAQVPIINEVFSPSAAEVAHAKAVLKVFADNVGKGVASLNGQMLDRPHLLRAERILARAKALK